MDHERETPTCSSLVSLLRQRESGGLTPIARDGQTRFYHTRGQEDANTPAEVHICGEIPSELDRTHLASIGRGEGLEDTPRDTA